MPYTVFYEEVFGQPHGPEERVRSAEFATYEEAVAYCEEQLRKDVQGETYYLHHGLDFWISPEPEGQHFSSRDFMQTLFEDARNNGRV